MMGIFQDLYAQEDLKRFPQLIKRSQVIKGTALTLYFELPELGMSYEQLLSEIAQEGFTHISVVVQWAQKDTKSSHITAQHPEATSDDTLKRVIKFAHQLNLKVMIFPIIWVEHRSEGEWRGKLHPYHFDVWWQSYQKMIIHYAMIAREFKVWGLSVGSELSSLESYDTRWRSLIQDVKRHFKGVLTYSANWDHYDQVPFWDTLDFIGISAYYEIASSINDSPEIFRQRWAHVRWSLHDWHERSGQKKPILFTELGYPSHQKGAMTPWYDHASQIIDLTIPKNAFRAFRQTWSEDDLLAGAFLWTWWGLGGAQDTWYTLRGKPILEEVKTWLKNH